MVRLEPIPAQERIQAIDALRGFALIGIITSNMRGFNSPAAAYFQPWILWSETADRVTQGLIDCFVASKFITLFAVLFGLGFAVQMSRAEARGGSFAGFYSRRLISLAAIGALHAFLLWWGDILLVYALLGFLLLLVRNRSQDTLMLWAMILYWFPVVMFLGFVVVSWAGTTIPTPPEATPEALRQTIRIYAEGSYAEMFRERVREWAVFNSSAPVGLPRILGFFLFGLHIWRSGIFQNLPAHLPLLRKTWKWGLAVGLAGNGGFVLINEIWHPDPMAPTALALAMWTVGSIGVPALSLFYACGFVLLFQRGAWRRTLLPLAAVGRMALTNYLLQTVLCTTLFYSYGLGLFGGVGPLLGLIPTVAVYALGVAFSLSWLGTFRFGPLEWVWRCVTYASLQPMRRQRPVATGS